MSLISKKETCKEQLAEWVKEMMRIKDPKHKAIDIIVEACKEEDDDVVYTIVDILGNTNKDFVNEVASIAVDHNIEKLFDFMVKLGADDWDNFAVVALREDCINLFSSIVHLTPTPNYFAIFCTAASHGYIDILKDMIDPERDESNLSFIASSAINSGHLEIANFMIDIGADDWNRMANAAALAGNKELLEQMIERGANDFYSFASSAARGGYKEIYDDMISRVDVTEYQWDELIADSMEGGNREILFSIIDNVDIDLGYLASLAAEEGDIELLNNLIERGVDFWGNVSEFISRGGRSILDEAIRRGFNDWNGLAIQALYSDDIPLFYEMLGRGANNFSKMAEVYSSSGNKEVIQVILDRSDRDLTSELHFGIHEDARVYFTRTQ